MIIDEKSTILRPIWCAFNGFWWWRFSLAISDSKSGTEILSWRGRGCQNSSLRKLNDILDELEMKEQPVKEQPKSTKTKKKQQSQNSLLILNTKKTSKK